MNFLKSSLIVATGLGWLLAISRSIAFGEIATRFSAEQLWSNTPQFVPPRPSWADAELTMWLSLADRARVEPIPDRLLYTQKNADEYGAKALALVTAIRCHPQNGDSAQAGKILVALADGFDAHSAYVTNNYGLDFAVSLPMFVYVYRVIESTLSSQDRQSIVTHWFMPAAERIQATAYGRPSDHPADDARRQKSNIRAWQNAAVGVVGLSLGGDDGKSMSQWAIDNPQGGFRYQMAHSILADGMVGEGSWAYHLYSLLPWTTLALVAQAYEQPLMTSTPSKVISPLTHAFQIAVQAANDALILPSLGDGRSTALKDYGSLFFLANTLSPNPYFQKVVDQATPPNGFRSETALLNAFAPFMTVPPTTSAAIVPEPLFLPNAGVAILRSSPLYLQFESGAPQSHSNASRNALVALYDGATLLSGHETNGSRDYADHALNVYRRGLAYDTLLVDDYPAKSASDPGTLSAPGRVIYWSPGPKVQIVEGQTTESYNDPAVSYDRMLEMIAGPSPYVVDFLQASAATSRTFTLVIHGPDDSSPTVAGATCVSTPPSAVDSYSLLKDWQTCTSNSDTRAILWSKPSPDAVTLQSTVVGDVDLPTQIRTAHAPGVGSSVGSLALIERQAPSVTFMSVLDPVQNTPTWNVQALTVNTNASAAVRLTGPSIDWHLVIFGTPSTARAINPSDRQEYLECRGKHADLRLVGTTLEASGQVSAFRLKRAGISKITLNGKTIDTHQQGDYIEVTNTPFTTTTIDAKTLMVSSLFPGSSL